MFDPEGPWLGSATGPGVQILEVGDDYLMGVHRDKSAVEYLQVCDLRDEPTSRPAGP